MSRPEPLAARPCIDVTEFAERTAMSRRSVYRWCEKLGIEIDSGRIWMAELREKAFRVWNSLIQADEVRSAS